ncbi:MAG: type II CRISPR RNA-guided endonuclease Cas9 [Alphaproteobacteria bacterium]|nr:type II CRISPR RNA-guided endonuclease Cas9 [Alphaproteobacteria bacterium]
MGYILGLDVGIASTGFAGVTPEKQKIDFTGVHIFDKAENPKDGSSLALPRRLARGLRRVIRRRAQRKKHIRKMLLKYGFGREAVASIDAPETENTPSVWELRAEALKRKLTDSELARILFHIAKRRGFQSNSKKAADNDTEGKKALDGSKQLQEAMAQSGARTIGAYLATLPKQRKGHGSYDRFVVRDLLREEVRTIFNEQRRLGNDTATKSLQAEYEDIAFTQRPLQSSEKLVGFCFLEGTLGNKVKRAPKFSYSAELFVLWSKINNLRIKEYGGSERPLTQDEKNQIAELAHKNKDVKYKQIRKLLDMADEERFNISYRKTDDKEADWEKIRDSVEGRSVFMALKGYHAFKDALGQSEADWHRWIGKDIEKLDDIARVLSFYEDSEEIEKLLSGIGVNATDRIALSKITDFKKSIDISAKAARKILPFMQQGMTYDKACEEAGYNFNKQKNQGLSLVPKFEPSRNPVVDRALSQVRKVVNAIIRRYGMPETIIVEVARDLGKSFQDRREIDKTRAKNQKNKEDAAKHAEEILGHEPNGDELFKYRLWMEQKGFCIYSGAEIKPELLRDPVATQVDHILPYSRSYDDSYMNKVLCFTDENQKKGNKTPYEYLKDTQAWEALENSFARQLPRAKAERLLMKDFDAAQEDTWKSRHLNDTRYITRLLKNHLENSLDLGKGNRVQTRNGALTAHLRHAWGFRDKDRTNDRHHALDAIVLACSTQSMVQKLTSWNKYEARKKNPAKRQHPPLPWEGFRETAQEKIDGIFVSRMPHRKISGQAHEETIRSIRHNDNGNRVIVQKVRLTALKPAALENLVDKDGRNQNLYNILKARLDAHKGDPQKAFAEPVKLAGKGGEDKAAVINSVRIVTNEKSGVEINGGLASNGSMIRVDVFQKEGKNYLCPIYVYHKAAATLPNGLIKSAKDEKDWPQADTSYKFLFSLYPNDLIKVKKGDIDSFGYYAGADRALAQIKFIAHDNDQTFGNDKGFIKIGVLGLETLEKYVVNYFGEMHKVKGEKRLGLAKSTRTKSGKTVAKKRTVTTGK